MKIKLFILFMLMLIILACTNKTKRDINIECSKIYYDSIKEELNYVISTPVNSIYVPTDYSWITYSADSIILESYPKGADIDYNEFITPKMNLLNKNTKKTGVVQSMFITNPQKHKFFIRCYDMNYFDFAYINKMDSFSEHDFVIFEDKHSVLMCSDFYFVK